MGQINGKYRFRFEKFFYKPGIYLVSISDEVEPMEIDIYKDRLGNLCCFKDDYDNGGMSCNEDVSDYVKVDKIGLEFISRIGDLNDEYE